MMFHDRDDAGRRLADHLSRESFDDPLVLALPRGGVPVAAHVAETLGAPLEVFVARKVGAPGNPEFGIGAIAEGSDEVIATGAAQEMGIGEDRLGSLAESERAELARRVDYYRGSATLPTVRGREVILVDDGLATGVTAEAALRALRGHQPRRLVLAAPVCPPETANRLSRIADDVECLETPGGLGSIGSWYDDFGQTSDESVVALLAKFRSRSAPVAGSTAHDGDNSTSTSVTMNVPDAEDVYGDLTVPADAEGIVLFAHGSGSSRQSPRNRGVAEALHRRGLATMLMDLLNENEEQQDMVSGHLRFDIELLAERLEVGRQWLAGDPRTAKLPVGLFGASTGAAAALVAAARAGERVAAVVSRGGRPDLAGESLHDVHVPTLLLVGEHDAVVLDLNRQALEQLAGSSHLDVVPGATHLFEEPGALDDVAQRAGDWFTEHLT